MPRRVIALDAGGTKLLAAVFDDGLEVHHRATYAWPASRERDAVLDVFARALREAGGADAVGAGRSPSTTTRRWRSWPSTAGARRSARATRSC
jgi:predicted NBD/HSP70 family sugar kinase